MLTLVLASLTLVSSGVEGLPAKEPKAVGMSASRLKVVDRIMQRGISAGGFPGGAVIIGRKGATVLERSFGRLDWTKSATRVSTDGTLYDVASLTKVVGTTMAIMILWDEGRLALDDRVVSYLPDFGGGMKDSVTIRDLLEHRSGLPAGRDLWRVAHTAYDARAAVLATPLSCAPRVCFIYSDLGADVLGMVAEVVAGQPLDAFLTARVFEPIGMRRTMFRPADSLRTISAPTEVAPPRGYPLRGEVHDENAHALGGVAGHAGLFSTATDLALFAQMMLNGGELNGVRIVSDSAVALFTARSAGTRALGWDTCDGNGGCGQHLGAGAYGHTGFTGTSLWIDPDRDMFVILLTNRVHAAKARRPSKVISDVRADIADAAVLAVMDGPLGVAVMPAVFRSDRASGWNKPVRAARSARGRKARSSAASSRSRSSSARRSAAPVKRSTSKAKVTAKHSTAKSAPAAKRPTVKAKTSTKPGVRSTKPAVRSTTKKAAVKPIARKSVPSKSSAAAKKRS